MSVFLLTITDALDAADNPVTLRFASGDFHADGENWPPRLVRPVLFAGGLRMPWLRDGGVGIGDAVLANADGRLDDLVDFALDGRTLTVEQWDGQLRTEVFRGTVARVELTRREVRLVLRDQAAFLAQPIPQQVYTGSGTLEGDADLAGARKPVVWGRVSNASPVLVNFGLQIYQVSSVADCAVTAARDRGVALTNEGAYVSQAELTDPSLTPSSGAFRHWQGFVRLGSTAEELTLDAQQSSNTIAAIAQQLMTAMGGTLAAGTSTATAGVYLTDERRADDVLDLLAASVGGYWTLRDSEVHIRALAIGTPVAVIPQHRMVSIARVQDGPAALPVREVTVRHDRVQTVQARLAAAATSPGRWQTEWRSTTANDAAVAARHPLSEALTLDTARINGSIASTLLGLLSQRRDTVRVRVRMAHYGHVREGDSVTIEHPRFGYASGRDGIVLRREPDGNQLDLEVWG